MPENPHQPTQCTTVEAEAERFRPSLNFWISVPIAGVVTWGIHELGHYMTGRLLGYDM
jgi:hypothetical protein